ncbi:uncharacterized protein LOC113298863 isoform X2 [Papaver somniferum]|uniref:uncharacterized protein LOC113298863 isoform X2 n=1 Tax=Papaver somniferum TaxID=3469 RepID=UPI000E6FDFE0|nr:uncharacterized protein LOC113298863 isoform X2 [Papaver somniferum]
MEKSLPSPPDLGSHVTMITESNKASLKRKSACGLGQMVRSIGNSCMNNNDVQGMSAAHTASSNKNLDKDNLQSISDRLLSWDHPGNSPASLLDRTLTDMFDAATSGNLQLSDLTIDGASLNHPATPRPKPSSSSTLRQPQTSNSVQTSGLTIGEDSLNHPATPRPVPNSNTASALEQPKTSNSVQPSGLTIGEDSLNHPATPRPVPNSNTDSGVSSAIESFYERANQKFEAGSCFITLKTDRVVFGRLQDVQLDVNDVNSVCSSQDVSVNCVMVYIRYLYNKLVAEKLDHRFVFVKPALIRSAEEAKYLLTSRSKNLNCELVFVPLYVEKRWFLVVVNLETMTCYWLDSSESPGHSDVRDSISMPGFTIRKMERRGHHIDGVYQVSYT